MNLRVSGVRRPRRGFARAILCVGSVLLAGLAVAAAVPHADAVSALSGGFIENRGQLDASVRFYAAGDRVAVYFTDHGPVLELREPLPAAARSDRSTEPARRRERGVRSAVRRFALGVRLVGATASAVEGVAERAGRFHYLQGRDPSGWRAGLRTFERVAYRDAWPGVDVIYRLEDERLVYALESRSPQALEMARFDYRGVHATRHGAAYRVETPLGAVEDRRPTSDRPEGAITLVNAGSSDDARSDHGTSAVQTTLPSAPTRAGEDPPDNGSGMDVRWGSFLGGTRDESAYSVALDAGDAPVVTGATRSVDFPTTLGVLEPDYSASFDVFVSKLSADGATLLWSTYLGDAGDDRGWVVRLDASDRPVVAGITSSSAFPTTAGAYDTTFNGDFDAFVTKLTADGSALVWSSYYGGSLAELDVSGLDLDPMERPIFVGSTRSSDLPTSVGALDTSLGGNRDGFVAGLSADGSALVIGTYLGGSDDDIAEDVSVGADGLAVVVGSTTSDDFPITATALQSSRSGLRDAFVGRLAADATSLTFSTYLGGDANDEAFAVALDATGRPLITGSTSSSDFPTTLDAYRPTPVGFEDAFVTQLASDGSALVWSSYFGGSGGEQGLDIACDASGRPVFVGWTCSDDFPLAGPPFSGIFNGPCDAFVSKLEADGTFVVFSSYVGGWRDETAFALTLDGTGLPLLAGETFSPNFPTTPQALSPFHNSPDDGFDGFVLSMFTPSYCTLLDTAGPTLHVEKAVDGGCPWIEPDGNQFDLIEGQLEQVDAAGLGDVTALACDSFRFVYGNDGTPAPGAVLFQLARQPGGNYTDGALSGLIGVRSPDSGDCP